MNNNEDNKKNGSSKIVGTVVCLGLGILCLIIVIMKLLEYAN